MPRSAPIARAAGTVALAVGLSRVLGLAREVSISHLFPSAATDAFVAAFRVPNLFRDLLAEGALAAAFVPVFTDVLARSGRPRAFALARSVLAALLAVGGAACLLISAFPRAYARLVAGGFDEPGLELTGLLGRLMAPFLVTVAVTAVLMGMANVRGRFFVPALAPAVFNVGMLAGAWLLSVPLAARGWPPVAGLGLGALAGGGLQLALLGGALRGWGFGPGPVLAWTAPEFRRVMVRLAPAAFAAAATYVNVLVDTQVASFWGTGPVSYLFFAMRLWMLPVGVIGVGLATAHLAQASRAVAGGDTEALRGAFGESLRGGLLLVLPATTALVLLAGPLVRVIYRHGAFGDAAAGRTAFVLALYAVGLPGYVMLKVFIPTFHARGDVWTPVRIAGWAVALKLGLNVALVPVLGWPGLALATGLAALAQAGLAGFALRETIGNWRGMRIGRALGAAATSCGLLFALIATGGPVLERWIPGDQWLPSALRLGALVPAGLVLVAVVVARSGLPEGAALARFVAGARRMERRQGDGR